MTTSLDPASIFEARNTTYVAGYGKLYESGKLPGSYQLWTHIVKEAAKYIERGNLANVPMMRPWRGQRVEKLPRAYKQMIPLDVHEATLRLDRVDVQYDKTGMFQTFIDQFLRGGLVAYDRLGHVFWTMISGAGPVGQDGVALFATNHPHAFNGGTSSNLAAGTAFSYSSVNAAFHIRASWRQENGEPYETSFDTCEVGEYNKSKAEEIFGKDRLTTTTAAGLIDQTSGVVAAGVKSNPLDGRCKIVVNPRLSEASNQHFVTLIDTKLGECKPMTMLEARFPQPTLHNQMDNERRVSEDVFCFGLDGDFNFGAGAWQTCYRIKE